MISNNYIQNILSNLPNSIYWKDKNGVYLGANIHAVRMVGFKSVEDIIGKTDYDFIPKEKADIFRKNDMIVLNTGKEICVEEESYSTAGVKLIQLSTKKPIRDSNGNIVGIMGVTVDITDRKKLEKNLIKTKALEEALLEKQKFLKNLNHEICTPLHVITTITDKLYRNTNHFSKAETKSFLSTLKQNNERLSKLTTNLLEMAKSNQRKSSYYFERKNMLPIIDQIINDYSPITPISLKTSYKRILVNIDELKISQVIRHILDNAIKYGDKRSIVIELKELIFSKSIRIKIQNTGKGISEEEQKRVFEPFFQGSNNNFANTEGAGLGLALCRDIVIVHKGNIWMEQDKENNIVSVNFTIPYVVQDVKTNVLQLKKNTQESKSRFENCS